MRTILFLLRKEFIQIFRNRMLLPLMFIMPMVQLLILSNAADYEVRNIYLHVIDHDQSPVSRRLIGQFIASGHFVMVNASNSAKAGLDDLEANRADLVLEIPDRFEYRLLRENEASLYLTANAINASKAGLANAYASSIIRQFNNNLRMEWLNMPKFQNPGRFDITYSYWFNPELEYKAFMVPGILVMLVTLIGMFLAGMNIVREKEIGTIEQLNVTPIHKFHFIAGKLLPFWIIANFELGFGLLVGKLVFNIPIEGSLWLVFGFAAAYLLVVSGLGLLVSTVSDTQQQAMFISYFLLVIFIMMSGLFTPIESMPEWAQVVTWFNPIAYFVEVMRLVLLKGSTFAEIQRHFLVMLGFAVVFNTLAILNYRKVAG